MILCNEDCFLFCHSSFSWSCRSAPQRLISTKSTDVSSFGKWYWQKVWPIFHRNFPTQAQPQRSNLSARTWRFDASELIMKMNPGRMPQEKVSTSRHNNSQISWLESWQVPPSPPVRGSGSSGLENLRSCCQVVLLWGARWEGVAVYSGEQTVSFTDSPLY